MTAAAEWLDEVRGAVAILAAGDPQCRRFGAARHRYGWARAASSAAELDALEARCGGVLAADVCAFLGGIGSDGAGPYYGLIAVTDARVVTAPPGAPWQRGLPLCDLGCGYAAVLALDGPGAGQIWLDARAVVAAPVRLAASFAELIADWIARALRGEWPVAVVPAGVCPLPGALSGYLGMCEHRLGLAAGSLAGPALREALGELGPGAIEIAADRSVIAGDGERVDPCVTCAQLVEHLAVDGLRRDVLAPRRAAVRSEA